MPMPPPMGSSPPAPAGWLPEAPNQGWIYRERVPPALVGLQVSAFYAARHRHSDRAVWRARLAAGEMQRNGAVLREDQPLEVGDRLAWHRPPWIEGSVPASWPVVFDDGDLHVIDKPAGLPVLPAGGWLEHTVLRLLERRHSGDPGGIPRPVHRLGRFTSGLLVCARRPPTRAWLSARLRESTVAGLGPDPFPSPGLDHGLEPIPGLGAAADRLAEPPLAAQPAFSNPASDMPGPPDGAYRPLRPAPATAAAGCRKLYRALLVPGVLALEPGESLPITVPIGRRPHPQLGRIWCAADGREPGDLAARSTLTLLERSPRADLMQVAIASGRPHQIRIHCAALGAPLLGDALYGPGGQAAADARPGDGGYRLQAWRFDLELPGGEELALEVPHPLQLDEVPEQSG
jgi:23S rRNA pseudouridine1911/1915/1917 synthase